MTKKKTQKTTPKTPVTDAELIDVGPKPGSKEHRKSQYADAWASGIELACGTPCTPPRVGHPLHDPLMRALRTHARGPSSVDGEPGPLLQGDELLNWIRESARAFREGAPPEVRFQGGWTVRGWVWWLDSGRPCVNRTSGRVTHLSIVSG
jgi:hypothetical protein